MSDKNTFMFFDKILKNGSCKIQLLGLIDTGVKLESDKNEERHPISMILSSKNCKI